MSLFAYLNNTPVMVGLYSKNPARVIPGRWGFELFLVIFAATPVAVGSLERNSSSLQCYNFTEAYIHFQTKSLIATIKLKPSHRKELT